MTGPLPTNGSPRDKAAIEEALQRFEGEAKVSRRRLESAVADVFAKVAAIAAGTLRPGSNDEAQPR